jgi:hypothetical protein
MSAPEYEGVPITEKDIYSIKHALEGGEGVFYHPLALAIKALRVERDEAVFKAKAMRMHEERKHPPHPGILKHKAEERHEHDEFFGDIPTVNPYSAMEGDRVVFGWNNRWTLLKKLKLSCPDCGQAEMSWVVQRKKGSGEVQVWCFDDPDFWRKVVTPKNYKRKLERHPQYMAYTKAKMKAETEAFRERVRTDPEFRAHMEKVSPRSIEFLEEENPGE